ncbi:MAG: RbsD/FucU domain-containing protein [Luteolibacter sp.]
MLKHGILNPHVLSLIARVRHTNTLVIADWAFPSWPGVPTVDLSLTHGIPTVLQVLDLLQPIFKVGRICQASEFLAHNSPEVIAKFDRSLASFDDARVERIPHLELKSQVPAAIGLIRTGDPTPYANLIIESA